MEKQAKICNRCLNTDLNPSIKIMENGLCNVCNDYEDKFDARILAEELKEIVEYTRQDVSCMVALSGGKDSTAMLGSVLELGFQPMAFSFQAGYNNLTEDVENRIRNITEKVGVEYQVIDIYPYIDESDRINFRLMADFYDNVENGHINNIEFVETYREGRKHYSTKDKTAVPFVRPCQACRKIAIKAYYGEAVKRNSKIVFVGINEWASIKDGHYSAIRRLKPFNDQPEVLVVHLPFLLQRKYSEITSILEKMGCLDDVEELHVETGGKCCLLANACEKIANEKLGFHLDSARLSREITVGFIDKTTAIHAIENGRRDSQYSVREVLEKYKILEE